MIANNAKLVASVDDPEAEGAKLQPLPPPWSSAAPLGP